MMTDGNTPQVAPGATDPEKYEAQITFPLLDADKKALGELAIWRGSTIAALMRQATREFLILHRDELEMARSNQ